MFKQVYIPYWDWEDWKCGMWRKVNNEEEKIMLKEAIIFTGDHVLYGSAMREVVVEWHNTMLNSLINISINRRAFLGHCAVCYKINIPESIVRMAWKVLTENQRMLADNEAQKTINEWEINHKKGLMNTLKYGNQDAIQKEYQMKLQLR